jgi:hypothetical protein
MATPALVLGVAAKLIDDKPMTEDRKNRAVIDVIERMQRVLGW